MAMSAKASDDIAWLPATAQLAVLAAKKVSSAELVELYLSRIDTYNASLNAIVTVDPDAARRVAKRSDAARARGDELGPLHGLPITVKDSYETAGMRTTCGRRDLADYVPTQDAEAVARLRRAGAIIMGKTNMPTGNQDVAHDVGGFAHRRPTGQAERARGTGEPTDLKQDFGLDVPQAGNAQNFDGVPEWVQVGVVTFVYRMQMHHVTRPVGAPGSGLAGDSTPVQGRQRVWDLVAGRLTHAPRSSVQAMRPTMFTSAPQRHGIPARGRWWLGYQERSRAWP